MSEGLFGSVAGEYIIYKGNEIGRRGLRVSFEWIYGVETDVGSIQVFASMIP